MELYNIRDLKFHTTKVITSPSGNVFRLHMKFLETSVQNCRYIFIIYSGKQRFIEVGFDNAGVYKILRSIEKVSSCVNQLIIKFEDVLNELNK